MRRDGDGNVCLIWSLADPFNRFLKKPLDISLFIYLVVVIVLKKRNFKVYQSNVYYNNGTTNASDIEVIFLGGQ